MKKIYSLILMCMFAFAASAQDVEINGVKYSLKSDLTACVLGCDSNTVNLVIPANVENDGKKYDVTAVAEKAFIANGIIKTAKIGANVTDLGMSAFEKCQKMTELTFEEGSKLQVIKSASFNECPVLRTVNFAVDGALTTIDNSAFYACPELSTMVLPASLKSIGFNGFGECMSLTEVKFADKTAFESFEPFAFHACKALKTVNIPASVKSIGDMAFTECKYLVNINSAIAEPFNIGDAFDYRKDQVLNVPAGTKDKYAAAKGWSRFKTIKEEGNGGDEPGGDEPGGDEPGGDDGDKTGIDNVTVKKNVVIYDLQGNRVTNPSKGLYIVNGKKVIL